MKPKFPAAIGLTLTRFAVLRYGENPAQRAALYLRRGSNSPLKNLRRLHGRDLSLVNILDINAGLETVRLFRTPAAVVIKHATPCGIALGSTAEEALQRAISADPESAFGGVVVLNTAFTLSAARTIAEFKSERKGNIDIIAAPSISTTCVSYLGNLRKTMGIYRFGPVPKKRNPDINMKTVDGGFIMQSTDDTEFISSRTWTVVSKKKPSPRIFLQAEYGWRFTARIRSNAVIVVDRTLPMTRGIGTGQTSRVRAVRIALAQAGSHAKGGILISDGFFPFDDSVKAAAKAGIACIVQPGGSIRDKDSVTAANESGVSMIFTGKRAFWH